jgi:hypothetical protein
MAKEHSALQLVAFLHSHAVLPVEEHATQLQALREVRATLPEEDHAKYLEVVKELHEEHKDYAPWSLAGSSSSCWRAREIARLLLGIASLSPS